MSDQCNKCNGPTRTPYGLQDKYGLIDVKVISGYYSPVLPDCTKYEFSLCEKCIVELFDSFMTPPKTYNVSCFDDEINQEIDYVSPTKFWL